MTEHLFFSQLNVTNTIDINACSHHQIVAYVSSSVTGTDSDSTCLSELRQGCHIATAYLGTKGRDAKMLLPIWAQRAGMPKCSCLSGLKGQGCQNAPAYLGSKGRYATTLPAIAT
jgi:hypothetical protein